MKGRGLIGANLGIGIKEGLDGKIEKSIITPGRFSPLEFKASWRDAVLFN